MTELEAIKKEYEEKKEAVISRCEAARKRIKQEFNGLKTLAELSNHPYENGVSSIEFALCDGDKISLRLNFHDNKVMFVYMKGGEYWMS